MLVCYISYCRRVNFVHQILHIFQGFTSIFLVACLLVAVLLVFASFLCSEIMSLKVEKNQKGLSKGQVSFTIKTSNPVSQKTGPCNHTMCQYIKHWLPFYLSNSSSLSLKRLFRMLMMCPSIGVGSCAIVFWPEIAWASQSHDLNFFLSSEQP